MNGKQLFFLLLLPCLILGCNSGADSKTSSTNNRTQHKSEGRSDDATRNDNATIASTSEIESDIPDKSEGVFQRYNAAKKLLKEWNQAIDKHTTEDLDDLFADKVIYYGKKLDKKAVIDQKKQWLLKHPSYRQRIGYSEVYYNDLDTNGVEFVASFTKICVEKSKKTEVESFLYFRKFGKHWKIVRETDVPTEVSNARKAPSSTLPKGDYSFYLGYWSDTRDVENFAHDQVPYNAALDLTIGSDGITGIYNQYSGTLRSRSYYLVKSGKIEKGILELEMVYSNSSDPSPEDLEGDEESETWRFKIIDGKQLTGLSKDNLFSYGRSMLLYEE